MKKFIIFFLFITYVFASEEIEVSLSTNKPLMPLYLSKVFNEEASFDSPYLEEIKQILSFDLNYNGFTQIVKSNYQSDFKVSHFDEEIAFEQEFWKNQKVAYVIKTELNKNKLKAFIYIVDHNLLKSFSDIQLSGVIERDREKLHKLSDNIQELLFGQKGIATSKILYTIRTKNENNPKLTWKSEIWVCDYDGHNAKQLTSENSYFVHPIFIPGKKDEFIYVSYINGQPKLFRRSLNKPISAELVKLRGNQLLPTFSQKGEKLAFICDAAGRPDIFLQHFDNNTLAIGKPIQLFSYPRATHASPSFSPDSETLAFVSDKDGTPRIYILKITDGLYLRKRPIAHLITKKNRHNVTPSWSKDGKKLAYSAKTNKTRQIWIYDFETNEEWQLTKGSINKENPQWANDSLHIIYNTEDDAESELYLINIKQKESIKITSGEGRKRFPSFDP